MNIIDLRSDTVTWPTEAMRQAMAQARVGDDVYGDDPTVKELEAYSASLVGKEAALFVPSGTFGNQLALFTHCPRGTEVILDEACHIVQHEAAGSAVIAGVQLRAVDCGNGFLSAEAISTRVRIGNDIHEPATSLIAIENAHSNGRVMTLAEMDEVRRVANRHNLPIHLDGARVFNAAAALGVQAQEIAQYADSVMFCLSKGLCAPVGSILAGKHKFIEEARRRRKMMGGGLRQAGILAAAGLVALKDTRTRIADDHETAARLAAGIAGIPGIAVDTGGIRINMVYFAHEEGHRVDGEALVEFLKERGILVNMHDGSGRFRFVTHYWIDNKAVDSVIGAMRDFHA
jgi:threonine aldolase